MPVVAVSGGRDLDDDRLHAAGFAAAYALTDIEPDVQRCIADPVPLLERLGRLIAAGAAAWMSSGSESLWRLTAVRHLLVVSLLGFASFCLTLAALPTWAVSRRCDPGHGRSGDDGDAGDNRCHARAGAGMIVRLGSGPALALGLLLLGAPTPAVRAEPAPGAAAAGVGRARRGLRAADRDRRDADRRGGAGRSGTARRSGSTAWPSRCPTWSACRPASR